MSRKKCIKEKNRYRQMNKSYYVSFYKETNVCEEKGCWAAYLPRGNNAVWVSF